MTWNSVWPDGTKSVKQNTTTGQQNTTYIETTLNNDHFWNIGADEDGYHRRVSMERYSATFSGAPNNAPIPTGMDGTVYLRQINGSVQIWYANADAFYQVTPGYISGDINVFSSFTTLATLPDSCYGEVTMYKLDASNNMVSGYFKCTTSICQAYSNLQLLGNSTTPTMSILFGNGSNANGLNLRIKAIGATLGSYRYKIKYWNA